MHNDGKALTRLDNEVVSKSEFARRLGVSRGRVSQLVQAGMPVQPDGKLDEAEARAWYIANIDPSRRRGIAVEGDLTQSGPRTPAPEMATSELRSAIYGASPGDLITVRTEHERLKAEQRAMHLARERGETLPKADVARLFGDLGRHHRETWSQFPARVAPLLAAEFGAPEPAMLHALETHVRNQLTAMVEAPPEAFADAG